jgi:hypothetical protein
MGARPVWEERGSVKLKARITAAVHALDEAITLGVAAAYPVIFNLPTPDPPPDWKAVVRFSWRVVRVTTRETVKILRMERAKKQAQLGKTGGGK